VGLRLRATCTGGEFAVGSGLHSASNYLVDGHLHHPHGDHCDDHGPLKTA
jgi:hypothetical protein